MKGPLPADQKKGSVAGPEDAPARSTRAVASFLGHVPQPRGHFALLDLDGALFYVSGWAAFHCLIHFFMAFT